MFGSRVANLAVWVTLAWALAVWELACRRRRPRLSPLDEVLASLMARPASRWLLLAGWSWLGWHAFVRGAF